jgi:hypothetical protein
LSINTMIKTKTMLMKIHIIIKTRTMLRWNTYRSSSQTTVFLVAVSATWLKIKTLLII